MARITVTIGYIIDENGEKKQLQKSFYGKTKEEALEKKRRWEEGNEPESVAENTNILFDEWIFSFFANDGKLALSTRRNYINVYKKYIKDRPFLFVPPNKITALGLQKFINECGAPETPLRRIITLLKKFFAYLELNGLAQNKTSALVLPKNTRGEEENEITLWTDEELTKILSKSSKPHPEFRYRFLAYVLYYTGLRISEALALKASDFDLEKNVLMVRRQVIREGMTARKRTDRTLTVGKLKTPGSYRSIPITEEMKQELKEHLEWQKEDMKKHGYKTEYLFTSRAGEFLDIGNLVRTFKRFYYRIGVPYKSFHTYRHTFATNLARTTQIKVVSALLGHANINVTSKYYVSMNMEDARNAINALQDAQN